jgi:methylmalonyl-CoA/ethylmalonyl-CoA epimerase
LPQPAAGVGRVPAHVEQLPPARLPGGPGAERNLPMAIKRIDHIAIAVNDLQASLSFWQDQLGLDVSHLLEVPEQQAKIAFLPTGGSEVELVEPTTPDSGLARYLAKRGPGIHHICFEVDDLAATLADLKARGVRLIDESPKPGAGGKLLAFIHPESANGVLIELYQLPTTSA